jgi:Carboxypeptidase regulatory-like domain
MKAFAPVLLTLLLCGCEKPGVVTGRVVLEGTPSPEREIKFDAATARYHGTNRVTTRHWVVDENHGLADVVVHIKGGVPGHHWVRTQVVDLVITGAIYQPYIIAVQTNQPVRLSNLDTLTHHVDIAFPRGSKNMDRGLGMVAGRVIAPIMPPPVSWKDRLWQLVGRKKPAVRTADLRFAAPDVFARFRCGIHQWEFAHMAVLDHPFFDVTQSNGTFTLPPLPPGRYTVEAIHPKARTNHQEVIVTSGQTNHLTITMRVPGLSR